MNIHLVVEKSNSYVSGQGWGITLVSGSNDSRIALLVHGKKEIFDMERLETEERNLYEQLEDLLRADSGVVGEIKKFATRTYDRLSLRDETVSLCFFLTLGDHLYLASVGEVGAYVFRDGRFAKLISRIWPLSFLKGKIKSSDVFLVSPEEFFNVITPGKINQTILLKDDATKTNRFIMSEMLQKNLKLPYLLAEAELVYQKTPVPTRPVNYQIHGKVGIEHTNLSNKFLDFFTNIRTSFGREKIDSEVYAKRNKKAAFIGIVLLVVLVVSIVFGVNKAKEQDFRDSYANDLTEAEHRLDESLSIFSLNKSRSRELFLESKKIMIRLTSDGVEDPELTTLKESIEKNQGKILGEFEVDPQNFVDLSLVTDNFTSDKVMFSNGYIYVVDKASRKIIKLSIENKRSEVLVGPNKIDEIYEAASYGDRVFVFNSDGIFEIAGAKKKVSDDPTSSNVLTSSFAGNLYLLDKGSSRIVRYVGDGDVFGSGKDWLASSVTVNLGAAKTMVIDGSIWVLLDDGTIYRFVQGNQQNFELDNSFLSEFHIDNIFVSDESEGLYVLDTQNGKVYVFDKSGKYVAQYISDGIKGSTGLVVSEKDKKLIVLKDSKLLSIDLEHLGI